MESPTDARVASILESDQTISTDTDSEYLRERGRNRRGQFVKNLTSNRWKRRRLSRSSTILQSIHSTARNLYIDPDTQGSNDTKTPHSNSRVVPVSLYTILARSIRHHTRQTQKDEFSLDHQEEYLLRQQGITVARVEEWAACVLQPRSITAAIVFGRDKEAPPVFLLLLFLRRRHMTASALGVVLRHIEKRVESDLLTWDALKIGSARLIRHARIIWPESIPWIASFFAGQANRLFGEEGLNTASPWLVSDLTRFCNTFLLNLSLPANTNPVLGAVHQEQAQFKILQFMASLTPAITVTRTGFRAVSRNQLAHAKTSEERDWAELKGPSWPPWKENRTAMDEEKGYEYGASRASRIIHRMYEAGYRGHTWEAMVEVYAGWDTDFSPTIQTRTSLPHVSGPAGLPTFRVDLIWAARVRTTRTRREAWACFLAYEMSGARPSQRVYLAMFENLYHQESERSVKATFQPDLDEVLKVDEVLDETLAVLLPGDMKEVVADPPSPLHYIYLSEPVPTFEELYHRLYTRDLRPSRRLLAFLLETAPTFQRCIELLKAARDDHNGAFKCFLSGQHDQTSSMRSLPGYLLAAVIRVLCRHGVAYHIPSKDSLFAPPERHAHDFNASNQNYLVEYAYSILLHYKPLYRPAWLAYMGKIVHTNFDHTSSSSRANRRRGVHQYKVVWHLIDTMEQIDLDVDDQIFNLACTATANVARAVNRGETSMENARQIFETASPRLRKLFHDLVGANIDMHSSTLQPGIPPHIPGPAELHAYVRVLGTLRDYEGLYSFATWLARHHVEVTARAEAQHHGSKLLFRTLVALRTALTGRLGYVKGQENGAPDEIVQLIRGQIDSVEEWGGWPGQEYVALYVKGGLKSQMPNVGGR